MKMYLKILIINLIVLGIGILATWGADKLFTSGGRTSAGAALVLIAFLAVILFLGIFLPIKWGEDMKSKLLTIFLMPTNYLPLALVIAVVRLARGIGDILSHLPPNFG